MLVGRDKRSEEEDIVVNFLQTPSEVRDCEWRPYSPVTSDHPVDGIIIPLLSLHIHHCTLTFFITLRRDRWGLPLILDATPCPLCVFDHHPLDLTLGPVIYVDSPVPDTVKLNPLLVSTSPSLIYLTHKLYMDTAPRTSMIAFDGC